MNWWNQLEKRRGSRPRCVLLVDGSREEVAARLTNLVALPDVTVSPDDKWMPYGKPVRNPDSTWDKTPAKEAILCESDLLCAPISQELLDWWLVVERFANTPNWDIASTCKVNGQPGLLLVEAKAHQKEPGEQGKALPITPNGWKNHKRIGRAIAEAAAALQRATGKPWAISRDSHYQLSNRFAWSWKIVSLGIPVVLVYLGFLNAGEMQDQGTLFHTPQEWEEYVKAWSSPLVPSEIWGQVWTVNNQPLIPLIRSCEVPFPPACPPFLPAIQ
ncbi:MAG: hypothetical protein GX552_06045 [Chloroflexi bacterium]|jgi:hypothetical protein|nr:hypothetical protein [Chloroflexota bacterium]